MASYIKASYTQRYVCGRAQEPIAPPIRLAFEDIRQLQDNHSTIEGGLVKLRQDLINSGASFQTLALLEQIRIASKRTQQHGHNLLGLVPLLHQSSDSSRLKAESAFGIPDLLEEVLTYLNLDEVLAATRSLGLVSPVNGFFDSPFLNPGCNGERHERLYDPPEGHSYRLSLPRFMSIEKDGPWSDYGGCWHPDYIPTSALEEYWDSANTIEFNVVCRPHLGHAPGARIAAIQLCCPHIHKAAYKVFCQCGLPVEHSGEFVIHGTKARGITIGDMAQHTNEVLRTTGHTKKSCTEYARVCYSAHVHLLDTDPITLQRRKAIEIYRQGWVAENDGRIPPWTGGPDMNHDRPLVFFEDQDDSSTAESPPPGSPSNSLTGIDEEEECHRCRRRMAASS
ncbi:hypothetical protein BST61_g2922 [Cercospora zeina]